METASDKVHISEVGPRDGLQSVARTMSTAAKCRWIDAVAAAEAGAGDVGLSDTTGMANPAQVRRLFTRLQRERGDRAGAAHMHNTRGLGLANCLAAFDAGVRTGVDLGRLIAARGALAEGLPGEPLYGMTPEAGLPPGFAQGLQHV